MAEQLEKLQEFFQEELIVKIPLVQYTIKNFSEKKALVEDIIRAGQLDQAIAALDDFHAKSKESYMALYLTAILKARAGQDHEVLLEKLIQIFSSVKKTAVVTYLAKEFLQYSETLLALNTLAIQYQNENNEEELINIWERILKQDIKNYVLPQKIGSLKAKQGNQLEAVRYYKMAFFRALEAKDLTEVLNTWKRLIQINPEDYDFYTQFGKKLLNLLQDDRKPQVYKDLLEYYFDNHKDNIDNAISLMKEVITLDPANPAYRTKIVTLYREKYSKHTHLEEFLNLSGLLKPWKNIEPQIEFFEKHIRFDNDSFVCHKSFGYGVIKNIEKTGKSGGGDAVNDTRLTIDFEDKPRHVMSLRIALNSLTICDEYDLKALTIFDKDKALGLLDSDPASFARAILDTCGKSVSVNDIKTLLVPDLIAEDNWSAKWKAVKNIFHTDTRFEYKNKLYGYNTQGASYEGELINQFFKTSSIALKVETLDIYLSNFAESKSDDRERMLDNIKELTDELSDESAILLAYIRYLSRHYSIDLKLDLSSLYKKYISGHDYIRGFEEIKSVTYKNIFIDCLIKHLGDQANEVLKKIFLSASIQGKSYILDCLSRSGESLVNDLFSEVSSKKEEYLEHYLLILKNYFFSDNHELTASSPEIYLELISLLEKVNHDISLKDSITSSRKTYNTIFTLLFESGSLFSYLKSPDSGEYRAKIFEQLEKLFFLENYLKVEIKELMTKLNEG